MFSKPIFPFFKHNIFRAIFWVFAGLGLLFSLALIVLIIFNTTPSLRHWGVTKLETHIAHLYQLDVNIDDIYFSSSDHVQIERLLLMDHQSDTLLMISSADFQLHLPSLFKQEINIESMDFQGLTAKLKRPAGDTLFNYEYLMPADTLGGEKKQTFQKAKTSSDWRVRLQKISLLDTYFLFEDIPGGITFSYRTDSSYISLSHFDLNNLTFIADKINADHSDIYLLSQLSTLEEEKNNATPSPDILPRLIEANSLNFHYEDEQAAYALNLSLDTAKLAFDTLDLNRQQLAISYVTLDESIMKYERWAADSTTLLPDDTAEDKQDESLWKIHANKVEVKRGQLVYHDYTQEDSFPQSVQDINLQLQDIIYRINERLKIAHLSFEGHLREPGPLRVSGKIDLSPQRSKLEQLSLALGKSHMLLNLQADLGWSNYGQWRASTDTLLLSIDDAFLFTDDFQTWIPKAYQNAGIDYINAEIKAQGRLSQLNIDSLHIKSNTSSRLDMRGSLDASAQTPDFLFQIDKLYLSLNETQLLITSSFANTLKAHPLSIQGHLGGKAGVYQAVLQGFDQLNTLDVQLNVTEKNQHYQYEGNVLAEGFNPQYWWSEEGFPRSLSLRASASGSTDLTHLNGDLQVHIDTLKYLNHSFQDITLESEYSERDLQLSIESEDEWADLYLTVQLTYGASTLGFQLEGDIGHLALQPFLGYKTTLDLNTGFSTEGYYNSLDDATINVRMHNFLLLKDTTKFALKEISTRLALHANTVAYRLKADSLLFQLHAEESLQAIMDSLQKASDAILQLGGIERPSPVAMPSFSIKAQLDQVLSLNEKNLLGKGTLEADWNYDTQELQWISKLDSLHYNDFQAYHLQTQISGNPRQLEFLSSIDSLQGYDMQLANAELSTKRNGADFDFQLSQRDEQDSLRFMLGTHLRLDDGALHLSLDTSLLMFNYQPLHANEDNFIAIGKDKLRGDIKLNWQGGGLSFQSDEDSPHARLELARLPLGTKSDSAWQAVVSGNIDFQYGITQYAKGYFLFDSLLFERKDVPSLAFQFSAEQDSMQQSYEVQIDKNERSDTHTKTDHSLLYLNAYKHDTTSWYGGARLHKLNLDMFQPLLSHAVDSVKGRLDGEIRWQSAEDSLLLEGHIRAQNVVIKSSLMDNAFYLEDESVGFDHNDILFDTFTIHDVQQQKLSIDGNIALSDFLDPKLSLEVKSKNFTVFDIPKESLGFFSGKGLLTSDIGISGSLSRPEIKGSLTLDKGSSIRYVSEDEALEYQQQDDVLVFTSEKTATKETVPQQDSELIDQLKLDLNIQLDPSTSAHLILTERPRNDALVNGGGAFTLLKNANEDIRFNGTYLLEQGEIQIVSPFLISRKLTLKAGSRIIFNDDPYNPTIDITLMYRAYASASALFPADESASSSMDFDVAIGITNKANDPTLNFELNVNDTDVQNALNTFSKEERERQALNLLFFNSFFVEGGEGSGFSARTEAEMMIANQLNRVANEKIKGIDINFAYENSPGQTGSYSDDRDLSYELSKQLNERLRIRLGGFVNSGNSDNHSENLIGDIILEYYLDEKKKNYLKIFRQNSYEGFFEGDVDVNGIGIVLEKNYRQLKDVFKGKKDE